MKKLLMKLPYRLREFVCAVIVIGTTLLYITAFWLLWVALA
jgi:hypothetical protein